MEDKIFKLDYSLNLQNYTSNKTTKRIQRKIYISIEYMIRGVPVVTIQ